MKQLHISGIPITKSPGLFLIAGPCVIESQAQCLAMARRLRDLAGKYSVPFIFKSSYDKANRMSVESYRGPGLRKGLDILHAVKQKTGVLLLSDVHCNRDVQEAAQVLDVLQIPALLCRQTDLILEAARTGKTVNVKKGQFMAPWDMAPVIKKIESTGNTSIIITERGASFGYNNLVSDFRSLGILRQFGYPVVYDATHSVQLPGGKGSCSGGQREFVAGLARAAVAFGCDGLFLEVHAKPDKALCDGPNMIDLKQLGSLLSQAVNITRALRT